MLMWLFCTLAIFVLIPMKDRTYSRGYGIENEVGMNRLVFEDATAALRRLIWAVRKASPSMGKAQITVWI